MKNVEVCVIIPHLNNLDLLDGCLKSIKKSNSEIKYKVVVIDECSKKEIVEKIEKKYKWIDLIKNKQSYGFSKANNIGIKFAYEKYNPNFYYFLNDDTKVTKNWLKNLLAFAKKHKNGGAFGSRQVGFDGKDRNYAGKYYFLDVRYYFGREPRKVDWLCGAGFMVTNEAILNCGGFDEIFFPADYEESDWLQRIHRGGFDVWTVPSSVIYHKVGATSGRSFFNRKDSFYENRIVFYLKYYPLYFFFSFCIDILMAFFDRRLKRLFQSYRRGWKKRKDKKIFYLVK